MKHSRIDIIGQNGNDGLHYEDVKKQMIKDQEDTVTITRKEYTRLLERNHWLMCLEGVGVDNWEGYGIAQEILADDISKLSQL